MKTANEKADESIMKLEEVLSSSDSWDCSGFYTAKTINKTKEDWVENERVSCLVWSFVISVWSGFVGGFIGLGIGLVCLSITQAIGTSILASSASFLVALLIGRHRSSQVIKDGLKKHKFKEPEHRTQKASVSKTEGQ